MQETLKRFNFSDTLIKRSAIISPKKVSANANMDISLLVNELGVLNDAEKLALADEWHNLMSQEITTSNANIEDFWVSIFGGEDGVLFPCLQKLIEIVLLLPTTSANCERIFSQINLIKTDIRSRLKTDTLGGILHAKAYIKRKYGKISPVP